MTINPWWGIGLSMIMAIEAFLVGSGATLTKIFGDHNAELIVGINTLLLGIGSAISGVLHAIPAAQGSASQFPLGPKV